MQLHHAQRDFEEKGLQVVLVGLGTPEQSEEFKREFSLPFPIICDPEKNLFSEFGLGRGTLRGMASPGMILRGLRAMSRGHGPGVPKGDVFQLPGVFLIDRQGNIRYAYYSKDPSDHPSVGDLLALKTDP